MNSPNDNHSAATLEQRAHEFMAQGRFRKARDEFKVLCKLDRARYLPFLIQANVGLAKEMLAKGMVSEARQVIDYLKTIAPPEQLRSLNIELSVRSGNPENNLEDFLRQLAQPATPLSEVDKIRLADQLIVAFKDLAPGDPEASALWAEVRAIHEALKAVSQEHWPRAAEALRPLPHGSCFGHWKLYVKGLAAFYQGEMGKAAAALGRLPAGSVPARASEPLLVFAGKTKSVSGARKAVPEPLAIAFCHLMGNPALGRPLAQADQWWANCNPAKAYLALRNALPEFPTDALEELGVLSDFFFNASLMLGEEKNGDWEKFIFNLLEKKSFKNAVENLRALRADCFTNPEPPHPIDAKMDMDAFIAIHQKLYGANPRLESQACFWLSDVITGKLPGNDIRRFGKGRPPYEDLVVELLNRSVTRDPENLPACLKLCQVYLLLGYSSERNRLLDVMARQFPDDKKVLLLAGRECIERKSFQKGFQYLERALVLDRIDPAIKDALVESRQRLARKFYQDNKTEKARQALAQNEPLLDDLPGHILRGRWAHRVFQGVCETVSGDANGATSLLQEARRISPCPEAFLLHAHLVYRSLAGAKSRPSPNSASPFYKELRRLQKEARTNHIGILLELYNFWISHSDLHCYDEELWIRGYIKNARNHPFTREEILNLVRSYGLHSFFWEELDDLLDKLLQADILDPEARFARFTLNPPEFLDLELQREIEDIVREASQRQDHKTARQATQLLEQLKNAPPPPSYTGPKAVESAPKPPIPLPPPSAPRPAIKPKSNPHRELEDPNQLPLF